MQKLAAGLAAACAFLACATAAAQVDEERAAALGIRKIKGQFLTLFTDLPPDPAVDELPQVFDLAVPAWSAYFKRPAPEGWHMTASLMRDADKFRACGLLHGGVPNFANGYSLDNQLWLYEQPSDYYRRHLLLHEGTHSYMAATLGNLGPPWYAEGVSEMLGTHRWAGGRLELGVVPARKEDFEQWGRVKIVRDEIAAGRGLSLVQVMGYSSRAHRENAPYGWCWAAASFFDRHPAYRSAFRQMQPHVGLSRGAFNSKFFQLVRPRWRLLQAEWQHYVSSLDYGYDVAREAIEQPPARAIAAAGAEARVDSARGWQSTGLQLAPGRAYRLQATGRFQVDDKPAPWISEANGVTLRYFDGRPVGMLLAAVLDPRQPASIQQVQPVGADGVVRCRTAGVLLLRVNESPALLADNRGELAVAITPLPITPLPEDPPR